jgi:Uma2 family endonuclease
MASSPQPFISEERYLALDRAAEVRSEYHDGQMFAMSGGTDAHATIGGNLFAEFRAALHGKPCRPSNSDLRLRIPRTRSYVYPDVMVLCREADQLAGQNDMVDSPHLIAEVISPSSEKFDRGAKFAMYKTIESLQEYMLISQDEPLVELFSRQPGGWFLTEARGLKSVIRIESLGLEIALSGIFERVAFPEPQPHSATTDGALSAP